MLSIMVCYLICVLWGTVEFSTLNFSVSSPFLIVRYTTICQDASSEFSFSIKYIPVDEYNISPLSKNPQNNPRKSSAVWTFFFFYSYLNFFIEAKRARQSDRTSRAREKKKLEGVLRQENRKFERESGMLLSKKKKNTREYTSKGPRGYRFGAISLVGWFNDNSLSFARRCLFSLPLPLSFFLGGIFFYEGRRKIKPRRSFSTPIPKSCLPWPIFTRERFDDFSLLIKFMARLSHFLWSHVADRLLLMNTLIELFRDKDYAASRVNPTTFTLFTNDLFSYADRNIEMI